MSDHLKKCKWAKTRSRWYKGIVHLNVFSWEIVPHLQATTMETWLKDILQNIFFYMLQNTPSHTGKERVDSKQWKDFHFWRTTSTAALFLTLDWTEYRFDPAVGDRLLHMLSASAHHIITHSPTDQCMRLPTGTHPHALLRDSSTRIFCLSWLQASVCVCCLSEVALMLGESSAGRDEEEHHVLGKRWISLRAPYDLLWISTLRLYLSKTKVKHYAQWAS